MARPSEDKSFGLGFPLKPEKPATPSASTGDTVAVACKVPQGLLLRVFQWQEEDEPAPGGQRRTKVAKPVEHMAWRIRGPMREHNSPGALGADHLHRLQPFGYAISEGVPREIWDAWREQNASSPLITEGQIFAVPNSVQAASEARKGESVQTGFEPLDPDRPQRWAAPQGTPRGGKITVQRGTTDV